MFPANKKGRFRALLQITVRYCCGGVVVPGVQFPAAAWVPAGVVDEVTVGVVPDELPAPVLPFMVPLLFDVVLLEAPAEVPAGVEVDAPLMLPPLLVPVPALAVVLAAPLTGHGLDVVAVLPVVDVAPAGVPVLVVAEPCCDVAEVAPAGVPGDVADVAPAGVPCVVPVVADPLTPGVLVFCVPELLVALVGEVVVDGEVVDVAEGEVLCGPIVPVPLAPVLPAPVPPVDVCAAAIPTANSTVPASKVTRMKKSP